MLLTACWLCIAFSGPLLAVDQKSDQNQKKYRIAYLEAGSYWEFSGVLHNAKKALAGRGWRDRVEFPPELHFSPGWGHNGAALKKYSVELLNRRDVDIILSAGTDATQAILAVNNGRIPIIGMCVSDPIKSGMVASAKDSGVDNFTVYFEPDAYKRLFRIFYLAVGFEKLGLLYSSAPNGKLYTNYDEAHEIARERGFQIVEYAEVGAHEREEECMTGIQWLLEQGIDAFYIPSMNCFDYAFNPESSQRLLTYLMEAKIPTFARDGTVGVRSGALLGLSNLDLTSEGRFLGNMIISILQGAKPRSLPMVFGHSQSLSLNLYTADRIGYSPSFDLLTACDVIFRSVTIPPHALPNR